MVKKLSKNDWIKSHSMERSRRKAHEDAINLALSYLEDGAPITAKRVLQEAILKPKA